MGGLLTLPATTTVALLTMALYARLEEAIVAGRLPRATAAALAVPGALATYGVFHSASFPARVLLGVVALHLLVAALGYLVVLVWEALEHRR